MPADPQPPTRKPRPPGPRAGAEQTGRQGDDGDAESERVCPLANIVGGTVTVAVAVGLVVLAHKATGAYLKIPDVCGSLWFGPIYFLAFLIGLVPGCIVGEIITRIANRRD